MTYIDPAGKLMAHLPRLAMLQAGENPAPINVEIDLSNRCSLGCEWCHFAYTHTRGPLAGKFEKPAGAVAGGDLMDEGLAKGVLNELCKAGVDSVTWTGGGEPTLHPQFASIVEWGIGMLSQGLYTHGGHIVDKDLAGLLKRAMTFVFVSMDASDRETYRREKQVDRFDAVCAGIRALVEARGNATIGVGYLVTERNWRRAKDAAQLIAGLGADYIQFRPTISYEQDNPDVPAEDTSWMEEAADHLRWVKAVCPNVEFDESRFVGYGDWAGHGYTTCWWSTLQTVITPNGKVWTCVNKREHPAAELGDLTQESFKELWARRPVANVDGSCRVACRGHVANRALNEIFAPRRHAEFV